MDVSPELSLPLALDRWRGARRGRARLLPFVTLPTFVAGNLAEVMLRGLRWRERVRLMAMGVAEGRAALDDGRSLIERLELEVMALEDRERIKGTREREWRALRLFRFIRDRAVIFRVGDLEIDPSFCEPLLRLASTGFAPVDGEEARLLLRHAAAVEPELTRLLVQTVSVRRAVLRRGERVTVYGERGTRVDPTGVPGGYRELPMRTTVGGRAGKPAFVVAESEAPDAADFKGR